MEGLLGAELARDEVVEAGEEGEEATDEDETSEAWALELMMVSVSRRSKR